MLGREAFDLFVQPLVLLALRDEQRGGERAGCRYRQEQPDERQELCSEGEPEQPHDRAGYDQRNEERRSSR
jgi:hypothetical protein